MKESHIQRLYWNDVMNGVVYSYGSTIVFDDRTVHFENLPFASGKPIKKWRSRTNYQANRTSPELPLLVHGGRYRLLADLKVEPENTLTIQVEYLNRQGEVIKVDVLRDREMVFTYPEEAFTYTITLSGAGCDRLTFKHLDLYAINLPKNIILEPVKVHSYRPEAIPEVLSLVSNINQEVK